MAPRTITIAIADALEDLSKSEVEKFVQHLLDRREEPRVKRCWVEGKNLLQLTDVLVQTFTEAAAGSVTLDLLRQIDCNRTAQRLEEEIARLSLQNETQSRPSSGMEKTDEHFVDKHRKYLIQSVSNVDSILDDLLGKKAMKQDMYDHIRTLGTAQNKMREIYSTCLKAGQACKDIFYSSLEENEHYLIEELKCK